MGVSGKVDRGLQYRTQLASEGHGTDNPSFLRLIYHAMAVGFRDKWT